MRNFLRPTLTILLVVLVTTWGVCPCTMAKALGIGGASVETATDGSETVQIVPPCCCQKFAPSSDDEGETPSDEECPCCKRGGWMRDLPPQAQSIDLDLPAPTFLDLPLLATAESVLLPAPEVATRFKTGPPTCQRPHAAPVGIVCLLS